MTDRTVGRLWVRYLKVREERVQSASEGEKSEEWLEMERESGRLRDRLVTNYSPLVKYVASRLGARVPGVVEQEDIISWGVLGLLDAVETYDPDFAGLSSTICLARTGSRAACALRRSRPLPPGCPRNSGARRRRARSPSK